MYFVYLGGGSVPVNALTLDEVHARENIHPSTSQDPVATGSSGQGMAAFNKLIAAMESSRAQQDCQKGVNTYCTCVCMCECCRGWDSFFLYRIIPI